MVLPGFNTDFTHHGETYHVQTEDNGANNPVVVTLLYFKGAILASRRTSYRDLLEQPGCQKQLMDLMKSQHKEIMRDLIAGKFDAAIAGRVSKGAPAAPPPPAPISLDGAIYRYLEEHAAAAARSAGTASHHPG